MTTLSLYCGGGGRDNDDDVFIDSDDDVFIDSDDNDNGSDDGG